MHVAIDARLVHYTRAGIGEYTLRLTRALAAAYPADRFTLLQDSPRHLARDHRQQCRHCQASRPEPPSAGAVVPAAGRSMAWASTCSTARISSRRCMRKGRSVITIHDLAFLIYPHFLTKDTARYYGQIDRAVRRADAIIAVSESTNTT